MKILKNLILIAAGISLPFVFSLLVDAQRDWQSTTGTYIGQTRTDNGKYVASYVVNDKTYNTTAFDYKEIEEPVFGSGPKQGDAVTIWYDPDNPQSNSFYKPGENPALPYIVYGMSGIMVLSGIAGIAKRK